MSAQATSVPDDRARAADRRGVALIGAGYWGARLARNLSASPACVLRRVCDVDGTRAAATAKAFGARATRSIHDVLIDPDVDAVVVATPARTHGDVVAQCLDADRHVLVEKPLACSVTDAGALADIARARNLVVMCDHTYCFAPVVQLVRTLLADEAVAPFSLVDSLRTNCSHAQPDVDVFWDLAHHDVAILMHLVTDGARAFEVEASTRDVLGVGRAHRGLLEVRFTDGTQARVRVDWHAGRKVRTMRFIGAGATLDWNDVPTAAPRLQLLTGTTVRRIPVGDDREPLRLVVRGFLDAIAAGRAEVGGPEQELAVLSVLEAATASAARNGDAVPVAAFVGAHSEERL